MSNWLERTTHRNWLINHAIGLLEFARLSPAEAVGAVWLDERGQPVESEPVHTLIAARMTYVYALGSLMGVPGSATLASRAMSGLLGPLHDDDHGGRDRAEQHLGRHVGDRIGTAGSRSAQ